MSKRASNMPGLKLMASAVCSVLPSISRISWLSVVCLVLALGPSFCVRPEIFAELVWRSGRREQAAAVSSEPLPARSSSVAETETVDSPDCTGDLEALEQLGIHGEGARCSWPGIRCDKNGCVTEITRRDARGDVNAVASLRQLQRLDLSKSNVHGQLDQLRDLWQLKHLDLSRTKVSGRLEDLENRSGLEVLDLSEANISGHLGNLSKLDSLRMLELADTNIEGRLEDLTRLKSLQRLVLPLQQLSGGLEALKGATDLEVLDLRDSQVDGNLDALQGMSRLRGVDLRKTHISGSLTFLEGKEKMQSLNLAKTLVKGELGPLRGHTALRKLDLRKSQVGGDLTPLKNLKELQELYLRETVVFGGLEPLADLTRLLQLDLAKTRVSGPLAPLQRLTELHELYLDDTQVSGDLQFIRHLRRLKGLYLSHTEISGDLAAVEELTDLLGLELSGAKNVGGELGSLEKLRKLDYLRLPQTQVSGNLSHISRLGRLELLDLSETGVSGNLKGLGKLGLVELDLRQTAVWGDVADLVDSVDYMESLDLSATAVAGDLTALTKFHNLKNAFLSGTRVTGWLSAGWQSCCKHLRELDLADSQVGGLRPLGEEQPPGILPSLERLNVSGCLLNGTAAELLVPLAATPLKSLAAARSGLRGELREQLDGSQNDGWVSRLEKNLEYLDLAGNQLSAIPRLGASVKHLDLSSNAGPVTFGRGVLTQVVLNHTEVHMEGTRLQNPEEVQEEALRLKKELPMQESRRTLHAAGYACADFALHALRVTPDLFLPQYMCKCQPGHFGKGANCKDCPANTFADDEDQPKCEECPANSTSVNGSAALTACDCSYGKPRGDPGNRSCQCGVHTAQLGGFCVPCSKLHIDCPEHGSIAADAPVEEGYARISGSLQVFRCLEAERCTPFTDSGCAAGYSGPLCVECAPNYHSFNFGKLCDKCQSLRQQSVVLVFVVSSATLALVGAFVAAAWLLRSYVPKPGLGMECAAQLLVSQGAVLLQLAQLWVLLARLTSAREAQEVLQEVVAANVTDDIPTPEELNMDRDPLLSYIEILQFTGSELQSFLDFQCRYDGATVRGIFALATPLLPLLVLVACACLELRNLGMGIQLALRALTVLFVGGASGAVRLLGCQRADGEGTWIPDELAFRPLFPWLRCSKEIAAAAWVDRIGWSTTAVYGGAVPCFLAFLFFKQHRTMRQCKTFFVVSANQESGSIHLELTACAKSEHFEEGLLARRLLGAAAAHLAVQRPGEALVELHENAVIVTPQHGISDEEKSGGFSSISAESFIMESDIKDTVLTRNYMMQMLTERSVLEEIQSDRMLIGAKQLLCKYAYCGGVWMEVALKLSSACLVSVVSSRDGLWLSVAITFGMAVIVGSVRPFAQPQVNTLQSFSFCCLALAAVGFAHRWTSLTHLTLLAPVVLTALQLLRPDSPEVLALRLQQELAKQIDALRRGESARVCAEEVRLL
ncbi:MIK2 [Symbiodinium sp. CCMP2592]|nr:MIK2 [Symbiodinium sp. CCMP2592]